MKEKDPILRFKKYLLNKNLISEEWDENLRKELEEIVVSTFEEIENKSDTEIEDIFKYHFEKMPPQLEEQLREYKEFLEGGK